LLEELKFPTSKNIKVKQRRWIVHLLREASFFRTKFGLGSRLPIYCFEHMDWPSDLEDKGDDLSSSLTDMSLPNDIKTIYLEMVDKVIPSKKYCIVHYFGALKSPKKRFPVMIEVTDDYLESINNRIASVSDHLRYLNYKNLLPVDLIELKGVPMRGPIVANEEGFCTGGSRWKQGTVGGILKYGETYVGITSGLVHQKPMEEFDALCSDLNSISMQYVDSKVDVAFFSFKESSG